jgi:predicted acetyltransferase
MGGFRVRTAREEDVDTLIEIGLSAYPDSGGFERRRLHLLQNSFGNLGDVRVIEKDGRIAGQAALYAIEVWISGRRIPCAGIASVAVAPGERRGGVSHALFEQIHAEVQARKWALSLLYPFREGFYARLGYATTAPLVTMRVATDALAHNVALSEAATTFRFCTLDEALLTEARALYEEVAGSQSGRLFRSETRWLKLFANESNHWLGAVSTEGRLQGYVAFSYDVPVSHGRQTLVVHELTARDGSVRHALLAALGKQRCSSRFTMPRARGAALQRSSTHSERSERARWSVSPTRPAPFRSAGTSRMAKSCSKYPRPRTPEPSRSIWSCAREWERSRRKRRRAPSPPFN